MHGKVPYLSPLAERRIADTLERVLRDLEQVRRPRARIPRRD